jgi:hypothetical protein
MSLSNKILVSGCGFSWSGQERRTWVSILKSAGAEITDVGGPAVSNQWIINKAFTALLDGDYNHAVIQLTALGKLDVEVDETRTLSLVNADTVRNFTYKGVWPSSQSQEHLSKKLYMEYLYSPGLEVEDLYCKLVLLENWCNTHNVKLTVLQAYSIPWETKPASIVNDSALYQQYRESEYYQFHDASNSVPCIQYQFTVATMMSKIISSTLLDRVAKIQQHFS